MNREEKYEQALEFEREIERWKKDMDDWYFSVKEEDERDSMLFYIRKDYIKEIDRKHKKLAEFFQKEKNKMEQELNVKIDLKETTIIKKQKKSLNREIKALRREIERYEERIYKSSDEFYHEVYIIGLREKLREVQINPNEVLYEREDKKFYFFKKRGTGELVRVRK
ncbi:unnamed protein product, partial [marine sediment metagenome]